LDLDEDSGGLRKEKTGVERIRFEDVGGWSQFQNKITFIPQLKGHVLTPKFGKESDLWVQLGEEFVWWKEGFLRCIRQRDPRSAICFLSAREQLS
jgi:hypothetical protein